MAKELRITFKESEAHLYNYIKQKSSPSAFLKDLASIEQKREELYLTNQAVTVRSVAQDEEPVIDVKEIDELDISDLKDL